ncbi:GntR family transcriptional regulator [Gordonia sp. DT30]|uniref:GntR family transcriptional regulator n=1 Tax=Gordonia sp. DT30 TaxID=3416546 RepID=UPI003CEDDD84
MSATFDPASDSDLPDSDPTDSAAVIPLGERAYLEIREQIATGRIVPAQRLTERSLALSLGMSPTPVREALRRLEQEGLVEKTGPRTLVVVEHSAEALAELQSAEVAIRGVLAGFAAEKATPDQIALLRSRLRDLETAAREGIPRVILVAARRFDDTVAKVADNPVVTRLAQSCEVVGRSARLEAIEVMTQSRRELGEQQLRAHADLVDAIAAHDPERAEQVTRTHLRSSVDLRLSHPQSRR